MKFYCFILLACVGCTSVHQSGKIDDVRLYRVTSRGVFSPSSTVIVAAPASGAKSPEDLQVLSASHGPGLVPAIANAGGIAGGAALLRPSKANTSTETSVNVNANTSATGGNGNGGGQFVPPGHINNPSQNH